MRQDKAFVDSLQIGRALAALAVALQHTIRDADRYYPRYTGTEVGYTADPRGWVELLGGGVDVFFVISGVVMVLSTQSGNSRPLSFLYRRFARIFPLWWVLTAVYIVLLLVLPQLFQASFFDPVHATCSMLLIPCTGPEGKVIPLIYAGWTLTYELVFYGLFALSLFMHQRVAQLLACIIMVLLWHGLHYTPLAANPAILHSSGNIMIEFIFGIGLGYLWLQRDLPARAGLPLLAVGVILIRHSSRPFYSHDISLLASNRLLCRVESPAHQCRLMVLTGLDSCRYVALKNKLVLARLVLDRFHHHRW